MSNDQIELKPRPSFASSVMSGIGGFFKGALTGGIAGSLIGGLVGAVVAGVALVATGGLAGVPAALAAIGASAGAWALGGGAVGATLGSGAGMVAGVVKSREENQPSAQDIVNVAKISFSQGAMVGQAVEKHNQKHREMENRRRTAKANTAEHHVIQ